MNQENFSNLAVKLGLRQSDDRMWGDFKSFNMVLRNSDKLCQIEVGALCESEGRTLKELCSKKEIDGPVDSWSITNEELIINLKQSASDIDASAFIDDMFAAMSADQFKPVCSACNEEKRADFYKVNQEVRSFCPQCLDEVEKVSKALDELPSRPLLGLVGALIGGLLGSIVWILIGQLGYVAAFGGLAIAFCAWKGYAMFDKKPTVISGVIILFAVLASIFFGEFAGTIISLIKDYDQSLVSALGFSGAILTESSFYLSIGMGLFFGLLGAGRMIYQIFKDNAGPNRLEIERL